MTVSQNKELRIWLSTLCVLGVLPFVLLLGTTGLSSWAFLALLWLSFSVIYVTYSLVRPLSSERAPVWKRLFLGHIGVRMGYSSFALILFFLTGLPIQGIIPLFLPLLADSVNQWFIFPRTRKPIAIRAAVYVVVILVLLWLENRL